jgi:NIPSNAP protein
VAVWTTELRDYRIAPGRLDEFVSGWRAGVVPLREAHGYRVEAAWVVREEDRFIWLISLDVPASEWAARNDAYYADPRRAALDPDPARLIVDGRHLLLEPVIGLAGRDV